MAFLQVPLRDRRGDPTLQNESGLPAGPLRDRRGDPLQNESGLPAGPLRDREADSTRPMSIPSTTRAPQSTDSLGSQSFQGRVKEVVQPISVKLPPKHLYTCTVGRNRSQARWVPCCPGAPKALDQLAATGPRPGGFIGAPRHLYLCTACQSLVQSPWHYSAGFLLALPVSFGCRAWGVPCTLGFCTMLQAASCRTRCQFA